MTHTTNADTDTLPVARAAELLADSPFFAGLDLLQRQRIARMSELQKFGPRELIYRPGEQAKFLYLVGGGMARLSVSYGMRQTHAGDLLRRGDVFGWAALTPTVPLRIGTATCLTDCLLLAIDGASLLAALEDDHTMGYLIMARLNRLITGTMTSFAGG